MLKNAKIHYGVIHKMLARLTFISLLMFILKLLFWSLFLRLSSNGDSIFDYSGFFTPYIETCFS